MAHGRRYNPSRPRSRGQVGAEKSVGYEITAQGRSNDPKGVKCGGYFWLQPFASGGLPAGARCLIGQAVPSLAEGHDNTEHLT